MATDPRAALDRFIAALEAHYEVARTAGDPDSPAVDAATNTLEDAFFTYDDALYTRYQAALPFEAYSEDDEDDYEEDEEEFEELDLDTN